MTNPSNCLSNNSNTRRVLNSMITHWVLLNRPHRHKTCAIKSIRSLLGIVDWTFFSHTLSFIFRSLRLPFRSVMYLIYLNRINDGPFIFPVFECLCFLMEIWLGLSNLCVKYAINCLRFDKSRIWSIDPISIWVYWM